MYRRRTRVGIERKILTSILWVGVLPMTLALIVGYLTARQGQSSAVRQTLLTAAIKTADGLDRDSGNRIRSAVLLAENPEVISLTRDLSLRHEVEPQTIPEDDLFFTSWIGWYRAENEETVNAVGIYDAAGRLLLWRGDTQPTGHLALLDPISGEPQSFDEAQFLLFDQLQPGVLSATVIAPIRETDARDVIGYVTYRSGINSILGFALGGSISEGADVNDENGYQLATVLPSNDIIVTRLDREPESGIPVLSVSPVHDVLAQELLAAHVSGTMQIPDYSDDNNSPAESIFLAYKRLDSIEAGNYSVYFLAYRPTALVYSPTNRIAFLALGACILFIAVLCINAYRDIHNNIVRPLSLLNEGAQIIRQGDFDLKLKIDTGDEIEELAQSFNKMAITLSRNVQQLESSEEKYRSLVDTMRDGIYQTDAEGRITFLNPAGASILGFDNGDQAMGGKLVDMFIDPIEFDPASGEFDLLESEDRSRMWMRRHDARAICVELTRNRLVDNAGRAVGLEGLIRDVTKSVHLEEEAQQRSERIRVINQIANVINSSLEAGRLYESLVIELRKLADFDYASVALLATTGLKFEARQLWPEEPVGPGHVFELDAQHSYVAWVARERRCLLIEDLEATPSPYAGQFPPGIRSCMCVPLYATGRIIGTLNLASNSLRAFGPGHQETLEQMAPHLAVAIRNAQLLMNLQLSLEEISRAREELSRANDELKTLDELKTNLLSNVSHELRTPLVSIMGYTDMILNGKAGPLNSTQHDYLEISLRNVEKLVTLIENLLDFSRLHRGDERLIFDTFDLADCARASAQMVKPLADSRGIHVALEAPEDSVLVEGDKGKMGQVFNNLLSNAVKFNTPGGSVEVRLKPGLRDVEVVVSDTGIGIPAEALDKVFNRFYQYDASSTRKYGGTGIGLSIVQDIVRLHGSTITVHSAPGEGTSFRFTLPLSVPRGMEDEPATDGDAHILVELITQDRSLGNQVRHFLSAESMDMIHAATVDSALDLVQRHRPDVIMFDAATPEDEAALSLLLDNPAARDIPILLFTNLDELYGRFRRSVAARLRSGFRKSTLLSGIHNAMNKGIDAPSLTGDKVLCIDDDSEILTFIERCLRAEGYVTESCTSGDAGLDRARSGEFGLVLLDVSMPGMDGWDVCRRIKDDESLTGIKVYLITAKPVDRSIGVMNECGADGFLLKPFRPEDLLQLMRGLEPRAAAK